MNADAQANLLKLFVEWSGLEPGADVELANAGWLCVNAWDGGLISAVAALNGTEIHFAVNPGFRHRVFRRHRIAEFLRPLFEEHGFLTTRRHRSTGDNAFIERLGFEKTRSENDIDHYMLSALPFERAKEN